MDQAKTHSLLSGATLEEKLASLDPEVRRDVERLIDIERHHPIRGYMTDDGLGAGVLAGEHIRRHAHALLGEYRSLFFGPAHMAVCTLFEQDLKRVGRRNGRSINTCEEDDGSDSCAETEDGAVE